jgi:tetratricopeptide (TPR) repeat protein
MSTRLLALGLAVGSALLAQTQSSPLLDASKTPAAMSVPPVKPDLTPESRGDIYMARKMYREAIDAFREGSQKDPVLLNKIGIAYHQMNQLDTARKSYQKALKLKKDYVEAMNNIGTVYYAKKSYRRAISWYEKALKTAPPQARSASIYMNLGTAWFARKKYDKCTEAYQQALMLDPDVFERHGNFGVMLEERSVQERSKYHFYMAKLYAVNKRNDLAIQYLRKALEEGYKDKKLAEEPDFAALRELPEFKDLLAREPRVL